MVGNNNIKLFKFERQFFHDDFYFRARRDQVQKDLHPHQNINPNVTRNPDQNETKKNENEKRKKINVIIVVKKQN